MEGWSEDLICCMHTTVKAVALVDTSVQTEFANSVVCTVVLKRLLTS